MDHRHRMWSYVLSVYIYRGKLKLVYVAVILMKRIVYEGGFVSGGATTIHLKVIRISKEPSPVQDHQVPIFIEDQHMFRSEQWDLTTYQVILRGIGMLSVFQLIFIKRENFPFNEY